MKNKTKTGTWRRIVCAVGDFFFPPQCIRCGQTYSSAAHSDTAANVTAACFCGECASNFLDSCRAVCNVCGEQHCVCECSTEALRAVGVDVVYSCFRYDKTDRKSASSSLIFKLKNSAYDRAVDLSAQLLQMRIEKVIQRAGVDSSRCIITNAPRRRRAVRDRGADHMKMTACAVASRMGMRYAPLFVNTAVSAQKSRDAYSRAESAKNEINLRRGAGDVALGRCVIIIDDVMTSGATLASCSEKIYAAGAETVILCVLAKAGVRF